jgi:N-alpha-acetyltransferase 40
LEIPTDKNKDGSIPAETKKLDYVLDLYTAKTIPSADFEACFGLIELTSSNAYDGSSVGWSPSKKRKEMKLPDMKYLIAHRGSRSEREKDGSELAEEPILGFLSFMVTYEDGKEVIYCYEIHLSPAAQGLGLGRQLMLTCEDIGRRVGLGKTMLTVFKSNTKAMRFYERCGFGVDEYSPQPRRLRNGTVKEPDYLILSKMLDNDDQWQTD